MFSTRTVSVALHICFALICGFASVAAWTTNVSGDTTTAEARFVAPIGVLMFIGLAIWTAKRLSASPRSGSMAPGQGSPSAPFTLRQALWDKRLAVPSILMLVFIAVYVAVR